MLHFDRVGDYLFHRHRRHNFANQLRCGGRGSSTVAVIPVNNRRSGLGMATFTAKVLMSRLVRLTSRCVAKSFSTPLKITGPSVIVPEGSSTRSFCPITMA